MGRLQEGSQTGFELVAVRTADDILPGYRGTAVGDLLAYHNLDAVHRQYAQPELLIGTCMDYRVQLRMPSDFAYVLRCAGGNLNLLSFDVSFAVGVAGIRTLCVIGHDQCRMLDVATQREAFASGLVQNAGWDRGKAEAHFDEHHSRYGLTDVAGFVWGETERLRRTYAGVLVAPLVYSLEDRKLGQLVDRSGGSAGGARSSGTE